MKTSELMGGGLDWAVAKCEGVRAYLIRNGYTKQLECKQGLDFCGTEKSWNYSSNWSQGGPIIERERICLTHKHFPPGWEANDNRSSFARGDTSLVAAMRCYVAHKLGNEIEIPEELK